MELNTVLEQRRSVRRFREESVPRLEIEEILRAGIKAPSGKNGQPWKFIVIQRDKKLLQEVSALTVYDNFVRTADCLICVLLDKRESYHYVKDVQAVGACIENMLLKVTDLGLGACWIGEILNRDVFVKRLLKVDNALDLMAVLAVGYPEGETQPPEKKSLTETLLAWH